MANSPPASPLRGWFGGKSRLTSTLIPLIPAHHCYAEVFAGAAWLLFHKSPSRTEALNDINADIINLYRVVQNHGIKGKFLLSINDVPQIREIFDGFHTLPVKLRYSVPSGGNQRANELLIANYPLFKNNI